MNNIQHEQPGALRGAEERSVVRRSPVTMSIACGILCLASLVGASGTVLAQDAAGERSSEATEPGRTSSACDLVTCEGEACDSLIADAWPSREESSSHLSLEGHRGYFETGPNASSPWVFVLRERQGQRQIRAVRIDFDEARPDMRPEFLVVGVVSSPMRTNRRSFRSVMRSGRPVGSASTGTSDSPCSVFVFPETVREGTLIVQFSGSGGRHGRMRVGQIRTLAEDELAELRAAGVHEVTLDPYVHDEASRDTSAGVLLVPAIEGDTTTRAVDALTGAGEAAQHETPQEEQ